MRDFAFDGAAGRCPACGKVNLREDQRTYRTLSEAKVESERTAKGLVVLAMGVLGIAMMGLSSGLGMGQGWAIGLPIVLGVILWDAAGSFTRRRTQFSHRTLWPLMLACLVLGPAAMYLLLAFSTRSLDLGTSLGVLLLASVASAVVWRIQRGGNQRRA
ncbi:MAG: hypothetical protein H6830_02645 [Planctomycetes bacterium]|nr:hypothetical protein [Planctomycetota bacterium]MCB9910159.1 hypothetical protein [Planctomycetota bacterium]HPF13299.1 hypothetical protein [Planctomycetota bacterium]HRV80542.1 hypothetical protein [Planctomycetota bacterium]